MRRPAVGAAGGPRTDGGASSSTQPPAANGTPGAVPRATAASPQLQLHPVTLAFSDARLEAEFTKHQADSQLAYDKGVHALHLVISLANCCYSAYAMTGSLVTPASIALTVPYQIVALLHWWLSRTRVYERHRLLLLLPLEAAYHAVCTVSMPHWVLAPATSWRHYLKIFSLGSGVLISAWVTFFCLKPIFWIHYLTVPLEYLIQTLVLTGPLCSALTSTPYSDATTSRVAHMLDSAAAVGALASPSCPTRGAGGGVAAAASCRSIVATWEVMCCLTLLYGKYRFERAARLKFAATRGRGPVKDAWPPAPVAVQVLIYAAVYLQVASAVWAWLGCGPLA